MTYRADSHEIVETVRVRDHVFAARCSCGHESEGPNPDTARKRHGIHAAIQDARATLREASER